MMLHRATARLPSARPSKKPKDRRGVASGRARQAFTMSDVKQDRGSDQDRRRDHIRRLLAGSGEPAPVDLARFRKRVGEIIAGAIRSLRIRRKKSD
jgi:hypothetical protein